MSAPRGIGGRAPRVCIVAHFAYGAMAGGSTGHAGGVERQTSMLARWLAARGIDASLVVWNEGQPAETTIDRVRVLSVCGREAGLPGLRFVHPRWTSLNHALAAADADLYYHNCAESVTGQVALWTARHRRKFVFSVASDPECDRRLPTLPRARERVLYRYGLKRADRVIAQTSAQARMLKDNFGLDAVVLPMPCPAPVQSDADRGATPNLRFIWVGRISPEKRVELVLDLAAARPQARFDIGGPIDDSPYVAGIVQRARSLPNVRLTGRVERDRLGEFYGGARALLCTSAFEGFPNTFLEAWSCGVPVVSLIDPDHLLRDRGLGVAAADLPQMIAGLDLLASDHARWQTMSAAAREYYGARHTPAAALREFENLFLDVLKGN
jgi:glycosyltransferase involved in cell wall biosynthesis